MAPDNSTVIRMEVTGEFMVCYDSVCWQSLLLPSILIELQLSGTVILPMLTPNDRWQWVYNRRWSLLLLREWLFFVLSGCIYLMWQITEQRRRPIDLLLLLLFSSVFPQFFQQFFASLVNILFGLATVLHLDHQWGEKPSGVMDPSAKCHKISFTGAGTISMYVRGWCSLLQYFIIDSGKLKITTSVGSTQQLFSSSHPWSQQLGIITSATPVTLNPEQHY